MTRILHLSDLHFGYHREDLVGPLLALVNRARADLVAVTGDLTHRGRPGQFRQAAAFLDAIAAPLVVVPGNHDVPLYNMPVRFLAPYAGYRRGLGRDLQPALSAGGARVAGLNSVDPFSWQRGILRAGDLDRLAGGVDPLRCNLVALHHPLEHAPGVDKTLPRGGAAALARLVSMGVRIALSGHLHRWTTEALLETTAHPGLLQVQSGTALCARPGDAQNEVTLLEIVGDRVAIERHVAPMPGLRFAPSDRLDVAFAAGRWRRCGQGSAVF
ncbi:metallophosphoesterase family protein [Paracoccus spongiarum]|uniref:Metallophosphoesterase n=1 Tax=Paracoccus spongiarum TaxID=3064387 RepID=A0ABT9J9A7_9RHOB|nr:metallophosphoesterase [Paracoccus sp. 2205BS29-5]MDP5305747.1 metallophosphoesterase [Paracoccus sp. 2205BS29-5]